MGKDKKDVGSKQVRTRDRVHARAHSTRNCPYNLVNPDRRPNVGFLSLFTALTTMTPSRRVPTGHRGLRNRPGEDHPDPGRIQVAPPAEKLRQAHGENAPRSSSFPVSRRTTRSRENYAPGFPHDVPH